MLLVAFLLYLAVEVVAFVVVAQHIGVLLAVVLVLVVSASGPFLVRRAGTGVVDHARERIQRGEAPDREVLDGVVLLLGGVLVCVPGFIGDVLGLLLLIGPVRHAVIRSVGHHLARRVSAPGFASGLRRPYGANLRRPSAAGRRGPIRPEPPGPVVDAATHDEPPHEPSGGLEG